MTQNNENNRQTIVSNPAQNENQQKKLMWVSLLLLVVALVLIFEDKAIDKITAAEQARLEQEERRRTLNTINHYLQMTHKEKELKEMSMELENNNLAGAIGHGQVRQDIDLPAKEFGIDLQQEGVNKHLNEDLSQDGPQELSIDAKIQSGVALKNWVYKFEERQRREYIRAFLENARADGLNIRLNDNLEVVSVERIDPVARDPQSYGVK